MFRARLNGTGNGKRSASGVAGAPVVQGWLPNIGDEQSYFYPGGRDVSLANRATLQSEINTYGATVGINLKEPGDYSNGVGTLTIPSGTKMAVFPNAVITPDFNYAVGASNTVLKGFFVNGFVTFPTSATPNQRNTLGLFVGTVRGTNATLEENLIYANGGTPQFDNSTSGWLRRNRFIRIQSNTSGSGMTTPCFKMIGHSSKSSYGNSLTAFNNQSPQGQQIRVRYQSDFRFTFGDFESYGDPTGGTGAEAIDIQDVDDIWITGVGGLATNQKVFTFAGSSRVNLVNLNFIVAGTYNHNNSKTLGSPTAAFWAFDDTNLQTEKIDGAPTNFRASMNNGGSPLLRATTPSSVTGTDLTQGLALLNTNPVGQTFKPWAYTSLRSVPDPLGPSWNVGLAGQPDSLATLQALADAGQPIYLTGPTYLSGPLLYRDDTRIYGNGKNTAGLIAKNPGNDVLRDGVPGGGTKRLTLIDFFIQGGLNGIHQISPDFQLNNATFSNIVFRNCTNGIFLENSYAIDNCIWEILDFVDCGTGIKTRGTGTTNQVAYVDKLVLLRNQFIRCGYGKDMANTRQNNSNVDVECYYKDCTNGAFTYLNGSHNNSGYVNCIFDGNGGPAVLQTETQRAFFVRCKFLQGPTGAATMAQAGNYFEGCEFFRNGGTGKVLLTPVVLADYRNAVANLLQNNSLNDMPIGSFVSAPNITTYLTNNTLVAAESAYQTPFSAAWCNTQGTPGTGDDTFGNYSPWMAGSVVPGTKILRERIT